MEGAPDLHTQFEDSSTSLSNAVLPRADSTVKSDEMVPVPGGESAGEGLAPVPSGDRVSSVNVLPLRISASKKKRQMTSENSKIQMQMPESPEQSTSLQETMIPLTESGFAVPRSDLLSEHGDKPPQLQRARTLGKELEDKFGRARFVVLTTVSESDGHFHWFRWPSLRQEWLDKDHKILRRDKKDRKANLMELYYDLIFVAVIGLLGHSIRYQATLSASFFVDFIALFHIWIETLFFLDRFDSGDGLSRVLVLLCMAGVVGMGVTGGGGAGGPNSVSTTYAVSFIWARTAVELMYLTALPIKVARRFVLFHHIVYLFVVAFFIGSIWAPSYEVIVTLQVIGFSIGLLAPMIQIRIPCITAIPINMEHIVERFALFSIIIIGETILGLLFNEGGSLTASEWGAVGLGLLLSFCLQWIGFDIENGMHGLKLNRHALRRGGFWAPLWIFSHIPYDLAVIVMAGGIYNVHHFYGAATSSGVHRRADPPASNYTLNCYNRTYIPYDPVLDPCVADPFYYGRWLLCAGSAAALFFITLNGLAHSRDTSNVYLNLPVRVVLRMACVIILALVPLAGTAISPLGYLGICCALCGAMVLVGLEHKKALHRLMKKTTSFLGRSNSVSSVPDPHHRELLRTLKLPETFDLSRVIDVDFLDPELQRRGVMHREMVEQNPGVLTSDDEYESR